MAKERATIEYCDNPNCLYSQVSTKEEPASGYHLGKGFYLLGGGGPIPAVYAHELACIAPAVEFVIEEANR